MTSDDSTPFRATLASRPYDALPPLPVAIWLDNVRSLYNVGAFLRTADNLGIERLFVSGITPRPPHPKIAKTALGAERRVRCDAVDDATVTLGRLREAGVEVAGVETHVRAIDLYDWVPRFPVCVVFGHEVEGLSRAVRDGCDTFVRVPTPGGKPSLNVATAGGVVCYELLRRYRELARPRRAVVRPAGGRLRAEG